MGSERILNGRSLRDYVTLIIKADAKNYTTPPAFIERNSYFFTTPTEPVDISPSPGGYDFHPKQLDLFAGRIAEVPAASWSSDALKAKIAEIINDVAEATYDGRADAERREMLKAMNKAWYHFLRGRVARGTSGPSVADIMAILGPEETERRLCEGRRVRDAARKA